MSLCVDRTKKETKKERKKNEEKKTEWSIELLRSAQLKRKADPRKGLGKLAKKELNSGHCPKCP